MNTVSWTLLVLKLNCYSDFMAPKFYKHLPTLDPQGRRISACLSLGSVCLGVEL